MSKKVLIKGWRNISHSFSMVNQHQLLSLSKQSNIQVYHQDMPFFMKSWSPLSADSGFSEQDQQILLDLPSIAESEADVIYQIYNPVTEPLVGKKTLTFLVTELGLIPSLFARQQSADLRAFTENDNIIVTPSKWSKERISAYGFAEDRIKVVPHGVDTNYFYPVTDTERQQSRSHLGIHEETIVFLNIGIPAWNKGIDHVIEAFARVNRQYPNTKLVVKDSRLLYGIKVDQIVQQVAQKYPELITEKLLASILLITDNLTQSQMRSLYSVADWYLSPYRAEGFNLPVLEAMASGCPVMVSSYGATDDFCPTSSAVEKIPTVFRKGDLPFQQNCAWVEVYMPALVEMMISVVKEGPRKAVVEDERRQSAVAHAQNCSWDKAVEQLKNYL